MRSAAPVHLTDEEPSELLVLTRRRETAQHIALRARIVLACAEGARNKDVAAKLGVSNQTVCKWRQRFVADRVPALYDEPRRAPRGRSRTSRSTRRSSRPSRRLRRERRTGVRARWLKARGPQSQHDRASLGGVSPPTASYRDVQAVEGPSSGSEGSRHRRPLHESARSRGRPLRRRKVADPIAKSNPNAPPAAARIAERRSHDYERHGTTSLFAALEVKTFTVIGQLHAKHRAVEFRKFLETIDAAVPAELAVHLVLDNYSTHKAPLVRAWLKRHPRFVVHFTPTYSSWLNQVERWFAELTNKAIPRGSHRSVAELEAAIMAYLDPSNADPKPFVWTKTADQILARIARFATATLNDHGLD